MKRILQTLVLALSFSTVMAQDPHWSQFYIMPQSLNPALIGAFNGNYRASGIFRGQWGSVLANENVPMFRTYSFALILEPIAVLVKMMHSVLVHFLLVIKPVI